MSLSGIRIVGNGGEVEVGSVTKSLHIRDVRSAFFGTTTVFVGGSPAVLIGVTNLTRQMLSIFNFGTTGIYLSPLSGLFGGSNTNGYAFVAPATAKDIYFSGPMYAVAAQGGGTVNVGVLDIG